MILESSAKFFNSASGVNTFLKENGTMVVELEFSDEEFQHLVKHLTTTPTTTINATTRMTASDMTNTTINRTRTREPAGMDGTNSVLPTRTGETELEDDATT
jgi:hypothetical protein